MTTANDFPPIEHSVRLAVFTGDTALHVSRTIVAVLDALPAGTELRIAVHSPGDSIASALGRQRHNLRRHGWRWTGHLAHEVIARAAGAHKVPEVLSGAPGDGLTIGALCERSEVILRYFNNVNDAGALAWLSDFAPDLGLSIAAPILKPETFGIPRLGTINIHKGKLPDYRGMPPAFWELLAGEKEVGITVHEVDERLDHGRVLGEAVVAIPQLSTPEAIRLQLNVQGAQLMAEVARQVITGTTNPRPVREGGKVHRKPTLAQEADMDKRLQHTRTARSPLREAALRGYAQRRWGEPEVTIFLYHRVNDDSRDNLTTGIRTFIEHVAFFRRKCHAVPLKDLLTGNYDRRSRVPIVGVTFDDGYRDNFLWASEALLNAQVPASFFVSTGKIDDHLQFEHDKLNHYEIMNWSDVRAMHDVGFEIGSHTVNHANLAQIDDASAQGEIERSKSRLEEMLGLREVAFAYPFGKRADISDQRRDQVMAAGYTCCCSAYGGVNNHDLDRRDIRRQGVNDAFSVAALRARVKGWGQNHYV